MIHVFISLYGLRPFMVRGLWVVTMNKLYMIKMFLCLQLVQVFLFSLCMGGIMYYLEYEPETMAPFLRGLIRRFLASRISNPSPPTNPTYLQVLDDMTKPKSQEKSITESSTEKYNLESIPGLWHWFCGLRGTAGEDSLAELVFPRLQDIRIQSFQLSYANYKFAIFWIKREPEFILVSPWFHIFLLIFNEGALNLGFLSLSNL